LKKERLVIRAPTPSDPDDEPVRLADAARLFFPPGSGITAASLRRMAEQGKLTVERIANKDFTTKNHIKEMRETCRLAKREPVSGSALPAQAIPLSGSSKTTANRLALAALHMKLKKPKKS